MAHPTRISAVFTALSLLSGCQETPVATEAPPTAQFSFDATVQMSGTTVAAGVGYGWGRGTITYRGEQHAFCVRGVALGDLGIAHIHAEGLVFNLNHLREFPGKYYAGSIGVAVIGGESTVLLKNQNGVNMQLETKEKGIRFNIAASGLRISMAHDGRCRE